MIAVIILAAGVGNRYGTKIPKQFLKINKKEIIEISIDVFKQCKDVDFISIVTNNEYVDHCQKFKVDKIVIGGEKRRESVYNGLVNLPEKTEYVIVHDAVRPLIDTDLVNKHISLIKTNKYAAIDTVVGITDNLIETNNDGYHIKIIPRKNIRLSFTPETFNYRILLECHKKRIEQNLEIPEIYDDASLVNYFGHIVKTIEMKGFNSKITFKDDLELIKYFIDK
ncbi:MAG: 2-C-methyl-D-erythritol 4-phosphate cytidylyltransferase [Candidatus Heimdallarchaeota archaeon]|nr:2-C-methyl-D-erythritol 4-phosphate cytidylyltransferase [Candidatus Heimdallarchaeota archaeon]MCK4611558.1 2-C-methyl-D-erythritol 4-phosphate cytidylyltransferase [Candidatus Heimdallarchaeota archaeon]